MRRLLRVALTVFASLLGGCALLAAIAWFLLFRNACDRAETVLSRDAKGQSVTYVFQACTTICTVTTGWVDLVPRSGHRIHLMTFVPWGGETSKDGKLATGPFEPKATWLSPNNLRISIGTVDVVSQRTTHADGVNVSSDIGQELYR
jgi:hypothetical protein